MAKDQKPTLKELNKHVAKYAAPQWEHLGIELDIDDDGSKLDEIKEKRGGDEAKCCLDVLKAWLQGAGEEPKTWEVLLNCLREIGANEAVQSIEANILKCAAAQATPSTATIGQSPAKTFKGQPTPEQPQLECQQLKQPQLEQPQLECQQLEQPQLECQQLDQEQVQPSEQPATDEHPQPSEQPATDEHPQPSEQPATDEHPQPSEQPATDEHPQPSEQPATDEHPQPSEQPATDEHPQPSEQPATDEHPQPSEQPATDEHPQPSEQPQSEPRYAEEPQQPSPKEIDFSLQLEPPKQVRRYQRELAEPGIQGENYIICAPTGTGKTLVAGLIISDHLQKRRAKGRVVFMVNTRPLAQQQAKELQKLIPNSHVECCTGDEGMGTTIKNILPENDIVVCTAGKLLYELQQSLVEFSQITLIVIDECHHTQKGTPHARVMKKYLEEKEEKNKAGSEHKLPQVVGLTASPGAGDNPTLEPVNTIDHLLFLCALMDATSGIKTVTENIDELEQHTNKPTFTTKVNPHRDRNEAFIALITSDMTHLEQQVDLKCSFDKWSQQYETCVQQKKQPLEMSLNPADRERISILELLRCYSQALNVYIDLRYEDAISVLNEYKGLPSEDTASRVEKALAQSLTRLKSRLATLPKVENPLLKQVEDILRKRFSQKPDSKGILFVRTKKHASAFCEWISEHFTDVQVRPHVITGHTRETGPGMTQVEQEQAIKSFHEGKYNLLVATSVAEEGLDVPACNLVIRFQHVSNEIAKVQTRGRARAPDSEGFTILASNSKKKYQEMRNAELEAVVENVLSSYFPRGEHLQSQLEEKRHKVIRDLELEKHMQASRNQKRKLVDNDTVTLKCKKCKQLACKGTEIYTLENATHHVVPNEGFKQRIKIVTRYPKRITENMTQTSIVRCASCDSEWGVICLWPAKGYEFPVLKCKSFIFEINGQPEPVRKWSEAPFYVPPLSIEAVGGHGTEESEAAEN